MANDNAPTNNSPAPQHLSSQTIAPGNHAAPSQPLEKQMLELARREKEVRKMQESLKGSVSIDSLKERAKSDRNSLLKELGLDDLIQEDSNDPVAALRKQIEDMQNQQRLKEQEAVEAREFEDLRARLAEKNDDFEIINKLGYENQVHELLKRHKSEHGEVPDAYEVAKQLQDTILQQLTSLKGTKAISELFKTETAPAPQARHPLDQNTTLTTSDRATTQQPSGTDSQPLSRQQLIEQASKHIKFND